MNKVCKMFHQVFSSFTGFLNLNTFFFQFLSSLEKELILFKYSRLLYEQVETLGFALPALKSHFLPVE